MNKGEEFLELESTEKFFSYKYHGISYWNLLRFSVAYDIILEGGSESLHPDIAKPTMAQVPFYLVIAAIKQIKFYFFPRKADVYLFSPNNNVINKEGKIEDRLTYFLLGNNKVKIQRSSLLTFSQFTKQRSKIGENNALCFLLHVLKTVFSRIFKRKAEQIEGLCEIIQKHKDKFDIEMKYEQLAMRIINSTAVFRHYEKYYYKVLKRGKYQCVITGCHYSAEAFAVISAAKKLKIPTIELQHGITGKGHISYNILSSDYDNILFPDKLLSFGDFWNQYTRVPKICEAIATGYPMMEKSVEQLAEIQKDNTLVFYSQGPIGKQLSDMAVDFIENYNFQNHHVIYKLHPSEYKIWRELYPKLINSKIQIIDYAMNVHELLAKHKYHVGAFSTVMYEALAFQNKVFLLTDAIENYMEELVKEGYAIYVKDASELERKLINSVCFAEETERFFKRNSIRNIYREIEGTLEKK